MSAALLAASAPLTLAAVWILAMLTGVATVSGAAR